MLAFDTETHLAQGGKTPKMVCLSTSDGHLWKADDHGWLDWIFAAFDAHEGLVNQNIAFDWAVVLKQAAQLTTPGQVRELERRIWAGYDSGQIRDTMIRGLLLAIAVGQSRDKISLGAQVERFLGETVEGKHGPDVWRMRYAELEDVPLDQWPEAAVRYARMDPVYALRLYNAQVEVLDPIPGERLHTKASWPLYLAGDYGVRTDPVYVAVLRAELLRRQAGAVASIRANQPTEDPWLRENGSRDMKALRRRLGALLGVDPDNPPEELTTPAGKLKTDRATIERVSDRAPDLAAWTGVGQVKTVLNTFMGPLSAPRVHPRWWPLVESGRLSCRNPNLTNQPKMQVDTVLGRYGVRECFVPSEGCVFVGADYAAAELRALAQVALSWCGYSRMAEAFQRDLDPHRMLAATLAGVSYEKVLGVEGYKALRQFCKIPNFGFGGGMGARTFAKNAVNKGIDLTLGGKLADTQEAAANVLKQLWYRTFPEMQCYHRKIGEMVEQSNVIRSYGEDGMLRGGIDYTFAANHFFQNLVARWTKTAVFNVAREAALDDNSPLFGSRVVIVIHDEIILDTPEDRASDAAGRLSEVMVAAGESLCPDIPVEAEPALMRRWYKAAEPVWQDGKLVPWEPEEAGR